ncbi:MAG: DUF58 domain-containing protein [Clostridiaceae bacterium]|nr:DUF58 domain-containing protein [Clostridiaceae bacterium]
MIKIKIQLLVFIVVIGIFAYLGGGNLPYSVLYSGILILVFGLIHITLQKATMKINLNIASDVFRTGDVINLNIVVKSFSAFPSAYMLVENKVISNFKKNYTGDVTFLNYYKEKLFSNKLELRVRGIYDFSETSILFTDLFCIMKVKKRFVETKYIKVYPRIYIINEKVFNERNITKSEDSNAIRDLRPYREGDSLKRVHWKLSAKHNELYVKNFEEVASKDTNIILNMNKVEGVQGDYDLIEEQMIDLATSLINYLQIKKYRINLLINNEEEKLFNITNNGDFQLLMEYFLNNKSQGPVDLVTFLQSKVTSLQQGSWIGIITLSLDEVLINEIMRLGNIGFKISVFYCRGNYLEFIHEQKSRWLEFIKCEKAIISLDE